MDERITILVVILCVLFSVGKAQIECATLPSDATVDSNLQNFLDSEAGESNSIDPNVLTVMYTCMAQGMTMGSYREVSVIVTYNNVPNSPQSRQFDLQCVLGGGGSPGWQARPNSFESAPDGYETLETRTNCSECRETDDNDQNCVACHMNCTDGLMRCTGDGINECCPFFDNGVCATSCSQTNHVANEQNNFTCRCELSCDDGFVLDFANCMCNLTDICLAIMPCDNGGICILNSPPDNYTCNCTGTGFMGTNCSDPIPIPSPSPSMIPSPPSSSSSSSSILTPSPSPTCPDKCDECNSESCCTSCQNGYDIFNCSCVIEMPLCNVPKCRICRVGRSDCCDMCQEGYQHAVDDICTCDNETISTSTRVRPTSTSNTPTGGRQDSGPNTGALIGIILAVIFGILLLLVLGALIAYLIYYFIAGKGAKTRKAKSSTPFGNGEAHDNPLYLKPDEVDELAEL